MVCCVIGASGQKATVERGAPNRPLPRVPLPPAHGKNEVTSTAPGK